MRHERLLSVASLTPEIPDTLNSFRQRNTEYGCGKNLMLNGQQVAEFGSHFAARQAADQCAA